MQSVLKWANEVELGLVGTIFHAAVHEGPSPYSEAQRDAWSPMPRSPEYWRERLVGQEVVLVLCDHEPVGFMSLRSDGYIDFAFILYQCRGQGLFRVLFETVEKRARMLNCGRLWTHASLLAQPAFRAVGFRVIQHEMVAMGNQELARAEMEKRLI